METKEFIVRVSRNGVTESHGFFKETWGNNTESAAKSFVRLTLDNSNIEDGIRIEVKMVEYGIDEIVSRIDGTHKGL